ncbi:MAG: hypothetical protein V2I97_10585, partial [Desulfococcaceae bacterium]|nr:hypothetical protein [Desulfococcaceae bacterium]
QKLYFCMNARQKTLRFTHVQRCKNTIFALLRKVFDLLTVQNLFEILKPVRFVRIRVIRG